MGLKISYCGLLPLNCFIPNGINILRAPTYLTAMSLLPLQRLLDYQAATFHSSASLRIQDIEAAIHFVEERGFIFFWPITGVTLPSLWVSVAGDRPVADAHDDPGHITWGWKDSLLSQRRWYYAKVLRKKATIISLELAPSFYALSENYGSPEDDYLILYEQGRLTQEARLVYEALLSEGPLDAVALRRATHMSSPGSETRFNRALLDLQADFKVLPVGVARAGAWNYAFIYQIAAYHYPELPEQARSIGESQARRTLAAAYLRSVGAVRVEDLARLFAWKPPQAASAAESLVQAGLAIAGQEIEDRRGEWLVLSDLLG